MSQCNNDELQLQRKYKQRQQQLLQSYKYCKRRRKKSSFNWPFIDKRCWYEARAQSVKRLKGLKVHWWIWLRSCQEFVLLLLALVMVTACFPVSFSLTEAAAVAASGTGSVVLATKGYRDIPLSSILSAAPSPALSSSSTNFTPKQQRQLQQQQLFALLKLDNISKSPGFMGEPTSSLSRNRNRLEDATVPRHISDMDTDLNTGSKENESESENLTLKRAANALSETTGYVSDDGKLYEKGEKTLATTVADAPNGQQSHIISNDIDCPKECKCLNDYFDCGKKHLDRVPTFPNYVQIIDLIGNKLNDTTVLQIRNLPNLNKLVLKRNQLETMPEFVGLTSLKHLSLAHNRIQRISPEALSALPKLKSLDLSKNFLHAIDSDFFPSTNRLAHLILNGNEISSIGENAFENLSYLQDIELNNNHLTSLPGGVFKNMGKLRKLSLNYNQLEINWSTFRGLTSLQKLFLKSNNIQTLQDGVFHVMQAIETIELDHNGISSLSRQGLFNLTKLHHLSLSNNSISRIEVDTWEFTQSLISLDLSHNNISEFKPQHLDCLQRLKYLNLAQNKIQYLMESTFDCVKNLEDLNLRRNKLSWIIEDPGAGPPFKSLRKLKKLDLYGNNLKQINSKSLSGLSSVESLNLGGNALASIQPGAFDHMTRLQKLTFKSLNFICDCEILGFKRWLTKHLQATGQQSPTQSPQAVCGYPEHLLDRELLSLQHNELVCGETPKPKLSHEPSNQLAVKGANITMECRATSPRAASFSATDELKIKWRHDNRNIKEKDRGSIIVGSTLLGGPSYATTETQIYNDPSSNHTTIIGYLRLFNVSYELAGKYQCVVSNAFGTTYSQKFKISIGIHPSFLQIPSNLTIDSGDTARLVCSATGDPTPVIALRKFGASDFPAATERRLQVLREENAFVITNAKPIDSGIYTCTANSLAGEIKVNATLTVNDKPQPYIPAVTKEIAVGKSSVLECLSEFAFELNQPHREWYKDNKPFHITPTLDSERYYFTAEKELLIIVNTQSADSGHYRCEITDNSKTFTMQMDLIVVKEYFSQRIIVIGVALVTLICIVVGSLVVWIILFYQKRKLCRNAVQRSGPGSGSRVAATQDSILDQTQMTTLNRTYIRSNRDQSHQRPRSLAALELNSGRYHVDDDDNQTMAEQRNCLIVSATPNYNQLLLQRSIRDSRNAQKILRDEDEELTLEYLGLNTSHDTDHQQDHLSSKDSGTGSDAANKRSVEDFSVSMIPTHASTPTATTSALKSQANISLAKTEDDNDYNVRGSVPVQQEDSDELVASPTLGLSLYTLDTNNSIPLNNNGSPNHKEYVRTSSMNSVHDGVSTSVSTAFVPSLPCGNNAENCLTPQTTSPQHHSKTQMVDI
ncbi:leucine-rich repeats and immunoglobulin-like domains protein lambik [Musca autumnalis]|uniref:leucine-rich repeats and immunoglobulin-like domains protein lambik n=1 Tax=Musca autumnalis TaxID=221902 RepID=UPI003CF49000